MSKENLGFGVVLENIEKEVNGKIEMAVDNTRKELEKDFEKRKKELEKLGAKLPVKYIKEGKKRGVVVDGIAHKRFDDLVNILGVDENVLLVGQAGSGKTQACEMASRALELDFYAMSVGAQTSKSDLLGFMNANGVYVETDFRRAYEKGGVFLMDEIDAGNANVLIVLNSALANGYCSFADKMVKKNKDFRFVASANTYGNGADRMYVGRNQLDSATLDRFVIIDWEYDNDLEWRLIEDYKFSALWFKSVLKIREYIEKNKIRAVISTRAMLKGAKLLEMGMGIERVMEMVIYCMVPKVSLGGVKNLNIEKDFGVKVVEDCEEFEF